jgi:hypothetical protein
MLLGDIKFELGSCIMGQHINLSVALLLAASTAISGCASKAENVNASYVSPVYYQSFNCNQLLAEAERVSDKAQELTGMQNKKATDDAVATGVALVLFWPAAFLVRGDNANTAELARLKGEMDAIEQASIRKRCDFSFNKS